MDVKTGDTFNSNIIPLMGGWGTHRFILGIEKPHKKSELLDTLLIVTKFGNIPERDKQCYGRLQV